MFVDLTLGKNDEAETLLRKAIRLLPKNGELHYSLGLLLAEKKNLKAALEETGFGTKTFSDLDRLILEDGSFNVTKRGAGLKGFSLYYWLLNLHWFKPTALLDVFLALFFKWSLDNEAGYPPSNILNPK